MSKVSTKTISVNIGHSIFVSDIGVKLPSGRYDIIIKEIMTAFQGEWVVVETDYLIDIDEGVIEGILGVQVMLTPDEYKKFTSF